MILCFEIGAACYRTEKAQIPKSAGGRMLGKGGLLGRTDGSSAGRTVLLGKAEEWHCSQQSPEQPALFPALSPALFRDLGFLSPVAGGPDLNLCYWKTFLVPNF